MENRTKCLLNFVWGHRSEELFDVVLCLTLGQSALNLALVEDAFLFVVENTQFPKQLVERVGSSNVHESLVDVVREILIEEQYLIEMLDHFMLVLVGHSYALYLVVQ